MSKEQVLRRWMCIYSVEQLTILKSLGLIDKRQIFKVVMQGGKYGLYGIGYTSKDSLFLGTVSMTSQLSGFTKTAALPVYISFGARLEVVKADITLNAVEPVQPVTVQTLLDDHKSDIFKSKGIIPACTACNDNGFILGSREGAEHLEIQKCDACCIFKTDSEASTAAYKLAISRDPLKTTDPAKIEPPEYVIGKCPKCEAVDTETIRSGNCEEIRYVEYECCICRTRFTENFKYVDTTEDSTI